MGFCLQTKNNVSQLILWMIYNHLKLTRFQYLYLNKIATFFSEKIYFLSVPLSLKIVNLFSGKISLAKKKVSKNKEMLIK